MRADPPGSADLHRPVDRSRNSRHRHQGRRPAGALRQGRQDRPVRRRRRRQDRADSGTDQQRRQGAMAATRCSPASASAPAKATTSITSSSNPASTPTRRTRSERRLEMRAGVRPDERTAGRPRPRRPHRPDGRRIFPRPGPGRAVLRRQHLPLHAGGFGSVGAARPYSFGRGLSADARDRHGRAAGTHHHHAQGFDHLGAGDLRAGRRLDRPGACHLVRPSWTPPRC